MKKTLFILIVTILIVLIGACGYELIRPINEPKSIEVPPVRTNYKVVYIVDNEIYDEVEVYEGKMLSLPKNPIKKEYTFKYWELDGKEFDVNTVINRDINLIAVFEKNANVEVQGIKFAQSGGDLNVGDSLNLKVTISPSNAKNNEITWTSSDTTIATVSTSGKVTAKGAGAATITAKTKNGKTATYSLDVYDYYDLVLMWGQSNMVGTMKNNTENNTKLLKNIDNDIVLHNVSYSRVTVDMPKNVAFEYLALKNTLVDISTNPKTFGENAYFGNGKIISIKVGDSYQTHISTGTNMIPYFAKEYYAKTHHKIIIVLAASGGRSILRFTPSSEANLYNLMVKKYKMAEEYILKKSDHNKIVNRFYVVYQGESDINDYAVSRYKDNYMQVHQGLMKDLKLSFGAMVYIVNASLADPTNDSNTIKLREVQKEIVKNNSTIIKGSDFPYTELSKGNKSIFCPSDNIIHLNSAGLSQVGREIAINIYKSGKIKSPSKN